MSSRRVQFRVSFPLPQDATVRAAQQYVLDAVACYCGSLKPPDRDPEDPEGDPMFNLDRTAVKVIRSAIITKDPKE